ncbi:MAG: TonB-dependent receptor plug domain-containing protein [Bacteroidales bacterium]|nr:TonB-dependent receptor plug domain-containing protein [Bacteroidales bacterium]
MKRLITLTFILVAMCRVSPAREIKDSLDMAKHGPFFVTDLMVSSTSGLDVTSLTGSTTGAVRTLIRGVNSLCTDSQPLWIVDGAILNPASEVDNPFWEFGTRTYTCPQSSFLGINPYDIESVEILKDISATSIYGSRGANGVVIINTKYPRTNRRIGARWNSDLGTDGMHSHTASVEGFKNNASYYISGFYRNFPSEEASADYGGFRFNFSSRANSVIQVGMSGMMSLGNHSSLNPMLPPSADISDDASEVRTTDSFHLIVNPLRGLSIKGQAGVDYRVKNRYLWYGVSTEIGAEKNGALSVSSMALFQFNASLNATYNRYFGKHRLSISAQADIISGNPEYNVMCGYDFYDYTLRAKGISLASSISGNRSNAWNWSQSGAFVQAAYEFGGITGLNLSFRRDYDHSGMNSAMNYPSAGIWVDIKKAFFADAESISGLKLTAGWGKAGSSIHVPYQWMDGYTLNLPSVAIEYQPFYKGYAWTVSEEANVGIEAGLFSDRIKAGLKYYQKHTAESVSFLRVGEEFGEHGIWRFADPESVFKEDGSIANEGLEFDIEALAVKSGNFRWSITVNGARNINVVESVPGIDNRNDELCDRWTHSSIPGYSVRQIVGYTTLPDGSLHDRNGDGIISGADMRRLASTLPKFVGGVRTDLQFGRVSFEAAAGIRLGSNYLDIARLLEADTDTEKARVTDKMVVKDDRIVPLRATLAYDVPLGKLSSLAGLKLSLCAANTLPTYGYLMFAPRTSFIGGISITL